jgi:phospho-N-acetylmuramoyl-pentapeptide-transferase
MIAVMLAGGVAMVLALIGSRGLITFFRNRGKGQPILGKEDHGPEHHLQKQGTPTMGGLAIIGAAFVGWFAAHTRQGLVFSTQAMIMWCGILVMAFMGFLDDYIKVTKAHNRGIFWKRKSMITFVLAVAMAWWLAPHTVVHEGHVSRLGAALGGMGALGGSHHLGHHQRGQRHRRTRRPRRWFRADGVSRVHDHCVLGVS